jgi:hypothetical protein
LVCARCNKTRTKSKGIMANGINVAMQRSEYDAYDPSGGQDAFGTAPESGSQTSTDTSTPKPPEATETLTPQDNGAASDTAAYSRFGIGGTVILGPPDYRNIGEAKRIGPAKCGWRKN